MADEEQKTTPDSEQVDLPPLTWTTTEYRHTPKGSDWYAAVGVIAVCFAITAFIFGQILFGILIMVAAGTLMLYALRAPQGVEVGMDDDGIAIGDQFFSYTDLESFWIDKEHDHIEAPLLLLKSNQLLTPLITVWIDDDVVDVEEVREHLEQFLEEEELEEPITQHLMELLGF